MHLRDLPALPITDPVLIFALVMVIILVAPLVFKRLKISGLVGLILAGTVIGPHGLGLFERDQTFILLGTVGLLYIMFIAGLEIDMDRFKKYKNHSMVFGALTFFIPQVLGTYVAYYVLGYDWLASILMASMFASHTLLAYPIASRLGIINNPAVTTGVGGTIITDTAALLVLAVILKAYSGELDTAFWVRLGISLSVYTAAVFLLLPRVGRWFFQKVSTEGDAEFVFVIASVFLVAFISRIAGLEPIIGAFMAGLALNRLIPVSSPLMNRIEFVGNAIFIPFFLISVGMLVNFRVFWSGTEALWVAFVMVVCALVFKFLAALGTGWILRYNRDQTMILFGLSSAQAAATLAVVLVAFQLGIFSEAVLNGTIIMILVTCIIAPNATQTYGRRLALSDERNPDTGFSAPQRILVPLSNPTTAEALMDIAFAMRDKRSPEPVFPLTVVRDGPDVQRDVAGSEKMLSHAVIYAAGADVPVNPITRVDQNISSGITRAVKERLVSTVIIGWNGHRSTTEQIFGGVLDQLLDQVRRMIMVCKVEKRVATVRHVYFAIPPFATLEPGFMDVLRSVMTLTNQIGAELTIIGIEERMARIRKCVAATKDAIQCGFLPMDQWSDLMMVLDRRMKEDDLFILQSAREGTLSWRPGLNRLPGEFTSRYPTRSFIAVYPSESETSLMPEGAAEDHPLQTLIEEASVLFPSKITRFDELAPILIGELHPKETAVHDTLTESLIRTNESYNSEIVKGVVLLEMIDPHLDEPRLLVAICKKAIDVPLTSAPVNVLALVAHPPNESPELHLDRLNVLARTLRAGGLTETLLKSRTVDGVVAQLRDGFQPG